MLFTSQGQSVLGKLYPLSRVRYPRPQAQFFPIQTSRLVNNIYIRGYLALKYSNLSHSSNSHFSKGM